MILWWLCSKARENRENARAEIRCRLCLREKVILVCGTEMQMVSMVRKMIMTYHCKESLQKVQLQTVIAKSC